MKGFAVNLSRLHFILLPENEGISVTTPSAYIRKN